MRAAETRDSPFEDRVPPGRFDYIEELATANAPPAARHPCRFPIIGIGYFGACRA